ncbi:hypothetical protein FRC07_013741 [Ceratobasidium sp. 392]|nr:hypothetical protein FRC07_013741 [Ceratobasidium sp. 392]
MLEPHLHRVSVLDIKPAGRYGGFVPFLLGLWSDRDIACYPGSLIIDLPDPTYSALWIPEEGDTRPENLENMLLNINTLRLFYALFDWDSNAYCGLVELQLCLPYCDVSISMTELTNILFACPALVILNMGWIEIYHEEPWVPQVDPIIMKCLEVIHLAHMKSGDTYLALSLITTSLPAMLSMTPSHTNTLDDRLVDFLLRSKIDTVYWYCTECKRECDGCLEGRDCEGGYFKMAGDLARHLPHAHTLVLDSYRLVGAQEELSSTLPIPPIPPSHLRSLMILGSSVDFGTLSRLVIEFGVGDLYLERSTGAY